MTTVQVFGIRHHGPGSARSLRAALETMKPDIVLIEGPPEANDIIPLCQHQQMKPPVAILVYAPDHPEQALYYPFAEFSPEWQALLYGLNNQLTVRFMDLPVAHRLALEEQDRILEETEAPEDSLEDTQDSLQSDDSDGLESNVPESNESEPEEGDSLLQQVRLDPLSLLANVAGYEDSERWWEQLVEERHDTGQVFQGINEAMTALRQELNKTSDSDSDEKTRPDSQQVEKLREAHMRKTIRLAQKEGFKNIAVVCGAWHTPALNELPSAKQDNDLLKGLPKVKTVATWVPWSYGRLSNASGYGAGIDSPGWYHHLWKHEEKIALHWLSYVAHCFREQGMDVSSAHVIETVRLAETLCAMRQRSLPGLGELNDAVQSVMLFGDSLPMALLQEKLIIGERLGGVPDETPMTPLQKDLAREQKRLRFKPSASDKELILDLRKPNDLEKSYLLRRLRLLNVHWGQGGNEARGKGTFKESWRVLWKPEFEIKLIEAGRWGNTIQSASSGAIVEQAQEANLEQLAAMAQDALFADLGSAVDVLIRKLEQEAAVSADVLSLMAALPELAHLLRYGNVRKTSMESVKKVVSGVVVRICIGLPNACSSLNEEAAEQMYEHIQSVQDAITLLEQEAYTQQWQQTLQQLMQLSELHALLAGRCCRLLLQAGAIDDEEAARQFGLALSSANDPADAAAWADGFLRGSGQLLVYDETLWDILDQWVCNLSAEIFTLMLPVLRRTFSSFEAPVRKQMGQRVLHRKVAVKLAQEGDFDPQRAKQVIPLISKILGLESNDG